MLVQACLVRFKFHCNYLSVYVTFYDAAMLPASSTYKTLLNYTLKMKILFKLEYMIIPAGLINILCYYRTLHNYYMHPVTSNGYLIRSLPCSGCFSGDLSLPIIYPLSLFQTEFCSLNSISWFIRSRIKKLQLNLFEKEKRKIYFACHLKLIKHLLLIFLF